MTGSFLSSISSSILSDQGLVLHGCFRWKQAFNRMDGRLAKAAEGNTYGIDWSL
jgi:hypothetical protein